MPKQNQVVPMAKGRKFPPTTRTDRFFGTTTTTYSSQGSADPSEFREEDVWSTVEDREGDVNGSPSEWEARAPPRRRNSREHRQVGGLSLAFEDPSGTRIVHQQQHHYQAVSHQMATSAPVNVPEWSKILRVDSLALHEMDDGGFDHNESEMVPPHEYLARSRKMAANSVIEGVGRTLKGRDLSRVRDAVWSQTGFDG